LGEADAEARAAGKDAWTEGRLIKRTAMRKMIMRETVMRKSDRGADNGKNVKAGDTAVSPHNCSITTTLT